MSLTLALAGDTMLGRGVAELIARSADPARFFSPGVRERIDEADLFLLNLECCVSERGRKWDAPGKPFHFRAPPAAARLLGGLGVGCVTLANNHALDYGPEALLDTRDHLGRAGIRCVGAGADETEARRAELIPVGGLCVGVLGVADHPADFAASPTRPGVAYADLMAGVPDWLVEAVRDLREHVDIVIVTPHWGPNMAQEPRPYIRSAARVLTEAGATLVAGHSAHVFHGVEPPVLYDLGDFIDDYIVDDDLRNDLGLLFLVGLDDTGPLLLRAVPTKLEYGRTRLARDDEWHWISDRFTRACGELGGAVQEQEGELVIELR
ncbi:CapA family protein [Microbispora sp. ATCC PTA-5024]|uniref:CapA family protein n=1 Tax=Microbispora sp. ATCC PTA-5024 TaxID=316330 RepID=UPI0003DBD3FB|nr:CapA family protein [Microbispora sp. ATCC PTA-5024]ETK31658.1 poly-gamma-glutamate biosynthesis protein [Microbispora sp. ATCC PTA-5024]